MPPLCTVGIGISLASPEVTFGALLLFLTNFVAITFAGIVTFGLLGFRPISPDESRRRLRQSTYISATLVLLISVPLVLLSLRFVSEARLERTVRDTVAAKVQALPDAQLVEVKVDSAGGVLLLQVTVRTSRQATYQEVVALQEAIATDLQRSIELQLVVVPVTKLDPLIPPTFTPTFTPGPSSTPTYTPTPTLPGPGFLPH